MIYEIYFIKHYYLVFKEIIFINIPEPASPYYWRRFQSDERRPDGGLPFIDTIDVGCSNFNYGNRWRSTTMSTTDAAVFVLVDSAFFPSKASRLRQTGGAVGPSAQKAAAGGASATADDSWSSVFRRRKGPLAAGCGFPVAADRRKQREPVASAAAASPASSWRSSHRYWVDDVARRWSSHLRCSSDIYHLISAALAARSRRVICSFLLMRNFCLQTEDAEYTGFCFVSWKRVNYMEIRYVSAIQASVRWGALGAGGRVYYV